MHKQGRIFVGTSGWSYPHWHDAFYPAGLPRTRELEHYAGQLSSVEVNGTFYRLPSRQTLAGWRDSTPRDFLFSVKMSRYATHLKKLKDAAEPLQRFFDRMEVLGGKLGPALIQLPPNWRFDAGRLESFLDSLDHRHRYVFEFRDPDWFDDAALRLLEDHGAALCIYDLAGYTSPKTITADFTYVRLHGPKKTAYKGSYATSTLSGWAGAFSSWRRQGRDVYCYFDNDEAGHAAANAQTLARMVNKRGAARAGRPKTPRPSRRRRG